MGSDLVLERAPQRSEHITANPALESHDAPAIAGLDVAYASLGTSSGAGADNRSGGASPARMDAVMLKRVQRSHGNRHVQRLLGEAAGARRAVMRSCGCGSCEQCRASAETETTQATPDLARTFVQARMGNGHDAEDMEDADDELVPSASSGVAMDEHTRDTMSSRFGRNFDDVRVHTDNHAATAADALGAEAFTTGRDIYFASGRYAPETHEGRHLLAHELAHTAQQAEGAMPTEIAAKARDGTVVGSADDPLEAEADQAADAVTGGDAMHAPSLSGDRGAAVRAEFSLKNTRFGRAVGTASDAASGAWNRGKSAAGQAWGATKQFVVDQIDKLAPGVLAFLRNMKTWLAEKVSAGFDGLFGGLAGRVRSDGIAGAIEFLVVDLAGGALKGLGHFVAGACSALGDGANFLIDLAKKIGGAAIERIRQDAATVGAFFSGLWTKYGAPALEALKGFAKSVWDPIAKTLSDIWDRLEPVRKAAKEAWDFVVGAYFEGKGLFDSFLDKLYLKAAEKWEDIKKEIRPYMGYVKVIAGILVLLSPMGPFVAVGAAAYALYAGVKYVWERWGKRMAADVRARLARDVLPKIQHGIEELKEKITHAKTWLAGIADDLAAKGLALLEGIGALSWLRLARSLLSDLSTQFHKFAEKVKTKLGELAGKLMQFLQAAYQFFAPLLEFFRQSLLIALVGPFAILDDGVWSTVQALAKFALSVPCIREIARLAQLPAILKQAERVRGMMKAAIEIIRHPDPIIKAIHDALAPMVEQVPGIAAAAVAGALYPDEAVHRAGITFYLEKSIIEFKNTWWQQIKKLGWSLIWPWDDVAEKVPEIIKHASEAIDAFFNLEISLSIDKLLKAVQDMNSILGALWGWFALAAVLIGAVLGALGVEFTAGASIGAGAGAGWALAEEVGLGLLIAAAATEAVIIGKGMFDLRFTDKTIKDEEEHWLADLGQYKKIADSTFALAVMGALIVLGGLVFDLVKSILGKFEGLIPEAVSKAVKDFVNKDRSGKVADTGDAGGTGAKGDKLPDPDSTARPGDFTPEEIAKAQSDLRQKAQDPQNVREVSDAKLREKYDAEVDLGDGRKYRRNKETRRWCLFKNPIDCGPSIPDVDPAVDTALGSKPKPVDDPGVDITDKVKAGDKSKPTTPDWTHTRNWEKWIKEKGGTIKEHADGSFTLTAKDGTSCKFSPEGDPDFRPFLDDPWGIKEVDIGSFDPNGNRKVDFRKANEQVGHKEWADGSPPDYTWHHLRGGSKMQLVPRRIHSLFRHSGGVAELP